MLGLLVVTSGVIFTFIAPLWIVFKYYSPKNYSVIMNIFWFIVSIISWPLVPIILAARNHDKLLLSILWISFLIMAVSGWYWGVLNIQTIIQFQQQLMQGA